MKFIKYGVLLVSLAASMLYADPSQYIVEQNLTNVAQLTLDSMYGKGNFIAKVDVQMTDVTYEERHTKPSNVGKSASNQGSNALPGLPSLSFSPENVVPYDSTTAVKSGRIKRVLVKILVNKDFPKTQARRAEAALISVLGLNPSRGDAVETVYEKFYYDQDETKQKIEVSTTGEEKLLSYQNLFYLLMLIFTLLFLFVYIIFQIKQSKLLSMSKESSGDKGPSVNINPSLELPEGLGSGGGSSKISLSGSPSIKHYFDFIDDSNIENFIYLLKTEKIKAEYVSMIVSFVSPHIGAKILHELDIEEQAVIASQLLEQKIANRTILDKLEEKMKNSLESFFGGETKFKTVFTLVPGTEKRKIMDVLYQNDMVGYQKFRLNVILFDDLVLLEDEEIERVVSDVNLELLATALISVDQDVYQRFDDNLSRSAKDMISQFLELKSGSKSPQDIEKAQDYILRIVKKFDDAGIIKLSEKLTRQ